MDALRNEAYRRGMTNEKQAPVILFQKAFLDNIRRNGRLDEIELIAQFKISGFAATRSPRFLFKDASLGIEAPGAQEIAFKRREGAR